MRLLLSCLLLSLAPAPADDLRLNQIQAIGSHNSYHVAPPAEILEVIAKFSKGGAKSWNYTHPPLTEQLDMGVRQFELDIFADTKGGLFADPLALKLAKLAGKKDLTIDKDALAKPGFKVLHIPDIDCWSNAPLLKDALAGMAAWSAEHPRHLPVMILLECKDKQETGLPTKPESLTRARMMELEKEILSAIPADRILKPDDVRGKEATLREAVLKQGWPALDQLRGKFLFALDNTNEVRTRYLEKNPSLEGRLIFASVPDEKHPAAAWFKCNDPIGEQDKIRALVKAGFLVRTRSDTNKPDAKMKQKAFDSGAQWVSTDHFSQDSKTRVAFEGGKIVRSNPISAEVKVEIEP